MPKADEEKTTSTAVAEKECYTENEAKTVLHRLCAEYPRFNYKALKEVVEAGPDSVEYFEKIHNIYIKAAVTSGETSGRTVVVINDGEEDANLKQATYQKEHTETVHDTKRGRVRFTHQIGDPIAGNPLGRHGFNAITIKKGTAMRLPEEVAEIVRDFCRQPLKLEQYDPEKHKKYFKNPATFDAVGYDPSDPAEIEGSDKDPDIRPDEHDRYAYEHGAPKPGFMSPEEAAKHGVSIPDGPIENIPVKPRRK